MSTYISVLIRILYSPPGPSCLGTSSGITFVAFVCVDNGTSIILLLETVSVSFAGFVLPGMLDSRLVCDLSLLISATSFLPFGLVWAEWRILCFISIFSYPHHNALKNNTCNQANQNPTQNSTKYNSHYRMFPLLFF